MKSIVLAAGYATRLYPLTENFPKPLLEIGGITLLDRLIKDIDLNDDVDQHFIVCNQKFLYHFEKWLELSRYTKKITLINDGSIDNENRLGAVRDLLLAIQLERLQDDLLVVAADNLVNFSFQGFVDFFKKKQTSLIMTYDEPDLTALRRTGVITMNWENRVLDMQEKPENPKSHWAVPPFYIYKKNDTNLIQKCVDEGCPTDAPGHLAKSMLQMTPFHAWPMPGKRYDIGTLETYNLLMEFYQY